MTVDPFPVAELDRVWQPPCGGRRIYDPKAAVRLGGASPGAVARAQLHRLVSRAPQVMVKVSGRQKGADHVGAHFAYIGRHGDLEVETEDGERLRDPSELRDRAAEWECEDPTDRSNAVTSTSMVLSMPSGTDAASVMMAARAFARLEFEGRHRYMLALHNDTDHPHVHLTVAVAPVQAGGPRFNPRKADLHRMRETFAHELRERGVEADATARRARGVVRRADNVPLRKIKERYAATGQQVEAENRARQGGVRFTEDGALTPWERAAVVRQQQVKAAYEQVVSILQTMPNADDRALGEALRDYIDAMPTPLSRRLEYSIDHLRRGGSLEKGGLVRPGRRASVSRDLGDDNGDQKSRAPRDRG